MMNSSTALFAQENFDFNKFCETAVVGKQYALFMTEGQDTTKILFITLLGKMTDSLSESYNVVTLFRKARVARGYRGSSYVIFINTLTFESNHFMLDMQDHLPSTLHNNKAVFRKGNESYHFKLNRMQKILCFPTGCAEGYVNKSQ